jgi:hypothetical protein
LRRAKFLVSPVPVIRDKQLLTVQTLAVMRSELHQIEAAALKGSRFGPQVGRRLVAEEDEGRRKEEGLLDQMAKKTDPEQGRIFKPPDSPRFQGAAEIGHQKANSIRLRLSLQKPGQLVVPVP